MSRAPCTRSLSLLLATMLSQEASGGGGALLLGAEGCAYALGGPLQYLRD